MQISSTQIDKVFKLHMHKAYAACANPGAKMTEPDKLTLSKEATELQNIKQFLTTLPDVRQEKVRELRGLITKDSYEINDADVAHQMFASAGDYRRIG